MAKTLDDIYREVLWKTSLTTNDLPYKYSSGGNYSFLQLFADVYKFLVQEIINTDSNFFLDRTTDDLSKDVEEYHFPNDLARLRHLELKLDGSYWYRAELTDPVFFRSGTEQALVSSASESHPYFWVMGSINTPSSRFRIAPRPLKDVTDGIKFYYDRMPSALFSSPISAAVSAASAVVTFPSQFDYLIPLGIEVEVWGKYGLRTEKVDDINRYYTGISDMKKLLKPRAAVGQKRIRDFREIGIKDE